MALGPGDVEEIDLPTEIVDTRKSLEWLRGYCEETKLKTRETLPMRVGRAWRDLMRATGVQTLMRKQPFAVAGRRISLKFGSGILSYYTLMQWSMWLNLVTASFWIVFAIAPWFHYYHQNDFTNHNNESVLDAGEFFYNVIGTTRDEDSDHASFFFYAGYSDSYEFTSNGRVTHYEMGQVYSMLSTGTFILALLSLVLKIGAELWDAVGREDTGNSLPTALYSWDWQVREPEAVYEKLLGLWHGVQAEFYGSLCAHGLHIGLVAEGRPGSGSDFVLCQIIGIDGDTYKLQRRDGVVFFTNDPVNNIRLHRPYLGLTRAQVRHAGATLLSVALLAGAMVAYYYTAFSKKALARKFRYLPALIIKAVSISVPLIQGKIVDYMEIQDPARREQEILWRVFLIRMSGIVLLVHSLNQAEKRDLDRCVELSMGRLFQQMLVIEYIADIAAFAVTSKIVPILKHKLKKGEGPVPKPDFKLATEVLAHLYRQVIVWIGCLYAPAVPSTALVMGLPFWFAKYKLMMVLSKTPSRPVAGGRDGLVFYLFMLATWGIACFPLVLFSTELKLCGAFHRPEECMLVRSDVSTGTGTMADGSQELPVNNSFFGGIHSALTAQAAEAGTVNGTCRSPLDYLSDFAEDSGIDVVTEQLFHPLVILGVALLLGSTIYLLSAFASSMVLVSIQRQKMTELEIRSLREQLRVAVLEQEDTKDHLRHVMSATRIDRQDSGGGGDDHFAAVVFEKEREAVTDTALMTLLPDLPLHAIPELRKYLDSPAIQRALQQRRKSVQSGTAPLPGTVPTAPDDVSPPAPPPDLVDLVKE